MKYVALIILFLVVFLGAAPISFAGNFLWPVSNPTITQYFGCTGNPYEPWNSQLGCYYHTGVDLAVACYTPVISSKWGTVQFDGWDTTGYGNRVDISDGEDLARYAHLAEIDVSPGQYVSHGQLVGKVGSTGNSTGCHLHFELRWRGWDWAPVNPLVSLNN